MVELIKETSILHLHVGDVRINLSLRWGCSRCALHNLKLVAKTKDCALQFAHVLQLAIGKRHGIVHLVKLTLVSQDQVPLRLGGR